MIRSMPSNRFVIYIGIICFQLLFITSLSFIATTLLSGPLIAKLHTIRPGISIAGVPVGDLSPEAAKQRLQEAIAASAGAEYVYVLDGRAYAIDKSRLQITYDIDGAIQAALAQQQPIALPLPVTYDRAELTRQLEAIGEQISRRAVPATLEVSGTKVSVIPESIGYQLDVEKSLAVFAEHLSSRLAAQRVELNLAVKQELPEWTAKELAGITTLWADQVSAINQSVPDRSSNVQRAAAHLNGALVLPGQTFSFVQRTGPYTREKGYTPSAIPADPGTGLTDEWAGGVSQVASALYAALLKTTLPVIERYPAPRPVDYAEMGLEAWVGRDAFDLRFVNVSDHPVYIHASVSGNQLRVALFGAEEKQPEVTLTRETVKEIPPRTIVRVDPDLAPNQQIVLRQGSAGYAVAVYQVWQENGRTEKKQVSYDYYKPLHHLISVGPVPEENSPSNGQEENGSPDDTGAEQDSSVGQQPVVPPDIPAAPAADPTDGGGTGEPRVENGIIFQE